MGNKVYRRLDIEDRMIIQACLHDHRNIEQISSRLDVSKSTISRELKRNVTVNPGDCYKCQISKRLIVCNTCSKKGYCRLQKRYYNFKSAQEMTNNRSHLSRSISKLPESSIKAIDIIISEGVNLGQSLHHIYAGDKTLQSLCCERTIRRLVYRGNLSIRPHQLRRYVRYCHNHKRLNIVQYDSLVGKLDDKQAILTITFPKYRFQFGLLIKKSSPTSVNKRLTNLFKRLGNDMVSEIFAINQGARKIHLNC